MCGIIGYSGAEYAREKLLHGLENLEYRGYDSAGIALWDEGKIEVIKAAANGDPAAVQMVLNHYQGYIIWLSTRTMYDACGKAHYVVDETLKSRLENKLIHKILEFKVR